ncbi:MAG: ABC transporter ATP-binding protein [Ruminococcus sp.]|nr:ABC transporter ATP-binding protein [Ruminococcus sp.]
MIGEVFVDLLQPKLLSQIVDDGVLPQNMEVILSTGLIMMLTIVAGGCCGVGSSAFSGMASQGFARDLRNDVFKRVMRLSFQQTDKFTTGSLVTRLTTDITAIQQLVDFALRMFVRNIMFLIGGMFMMMQLNVRFGIVVAVSLPLEVLIVVLIMKFANPLYAIVARRLDGVNTVMQENISGARVVKAYVREDSETARFDGANTALMDSNLKVMRLMALLSPLLMIIMNAAVLAVIYIGGLQVEAQALKVGEVMAAVTYVTQILHGIMMLSMMSQSIARASASAKRLNEVLDTDPVISDGEGALCTETGTVEFRNVSFSYPASSGRPVLEGINLSIAKGENVAILGATGSGKSSLVNLIPRFYDAVEGSVYVNGADVKTYELDDLRSRIGIVLQKSELFSATAAENIRWGCKDATDEEVKKAAEIAQADEFISKMPDGYDTKIAEKGASLSGGQKQRLSIARAILKKPEILIFDDSTSALDLKTEASLRQKLRESLAGTTVITIAQRIASVKDCDRIAVIDHGRLAAFAPHDELMRTCEVYKDIYRSQAGKEGDE